MILFKKVNGSSEAIYTHNQPQVNLQRLKTMSAKQVFQTVGVLLVFHNVCTKIDESYETRGKFIDKRMWPEKLPIQITFMSAIDSQMENCFGGKVSHS